MAGTRHILAAAAALALGGIAPTTYAQSQHTYGIADDDRNEWIIETSDGGYAMVGLRNVSSIDPGGITVKKLDSSFNIVWETILRGPGYDIGNRIIETQDGGFVIAGETSSTAIANQGTSLIKLDSGGTLQWAKAYPGSAFAGGSHNQTAIEELFDGTLVVTSRLQGIPQSSQAVVLFRTDANGNLIWGKYYNDTRFGTSAYSSPADVHIAPSTDGTVGIVLCGHTAQSVTFGRDAMIMATDLNGNVNWSRSYGFQGFTDMGYALEPTNNMTLTMAGYAKEIAEGGGTFVLQTDSFGNLLWYSQFEDFHASNSMELLPSGEVVLAGGYRNIGSGAEDASLLWVDGSGGATLRWRYGGAVSDWGECVVPTSTGYVLSGTTLSFGAGSYDDYLVETDLTGSSGCNELADVPFTTPEFPIVEDIPWREISWDNVVDLPIVQEDPFTIHTVLCGGGCVDAPDNMVGWWTLDDVSGTIAEEIVHNNWGTMNNTVYDTTALVNESMCFNGSNSYIEVANAGVLNVGTGDFSMDAWVRTTDTGGVRVIVEKRFQDTAGTVGYSMYLYQGNLSFQMADGFGSNSCSTASSSSCTNYGAGSPGFVADGNWHLVAVTVDRDNPNGGVFYVDGAVVGTFDPTIRSGSLSNANPLRIGSLAITTGPGSVFNGCIDEVELFDAVVPQADFQNIFLAASEGKCKDTCLADWNGDGTVNTSDFLAYLNDYSLVSGSNDPIFGNPDLVAPFGALTTADLLAYLNLFVTGCP